MPLCSNRPEGFSVHSDISSPIPTTCFVDTILIPLPTWIALALLPVLFALSIHHRKINYDPSTAHIRSKRRRNCLFTTISAIYYVLIICNILMQTLEIVRLELLHFSIGLSPFAYVGLLMATGLHWSEGAKGRIRGWQAVNGLIWVGGIVMCVIQVIGLNKEGIDGRKGSKYPISDQVIDVAVMAGVYAVLAILEVVLGFWRSQRSARVGRDGRSLGSGMSPVLENREFVEKYPNHAA